MRSRTLFLLSGFIIKYSSGSFINVDNSLDPGLVNQNQVFLNRKEKFIKFDTKDNELEIELGISIPFIKVPLTANRLSEAKESKITVNAPGLIVAGMLMLTSFLIIPLLFTTTSGEGFGFQRKALTMSTAAGVDETLAKMSTSTRCKNPVENKFYFKFDKCRGSLKSITAKFDFVIEKRDVWSLMEGVNEALSRNGIDSSSCMQKSICWIAKTSKGGKDGSIGKWVNYFLKTWWVSRLIGGTFIEEAVKAASNDASCSATYSHCSVTNKHFQSFAKMVAAGHY